MKAYPRSLQVLKWLAQSRDDIRTYVHMYVCMYMYVHTTTPIHTEQCINLCNNDSVVAVVISEYATAVRPTTSRR